MAIFRFVQAVLDGRDLPGNICELTYKDSKFNISRETIIEKNMRIFKEIERTTLE